jgi:nicotinamidase-related amidase
LAPQASGFNIIAELTRSEFNILKPMLLIIDMLNDLLDRWSLIDRAMLIRGIQSLADIFYSEGHPVVWVRQEFRADLSDAFKEMRRDNIKITIEGTAGAKIISELVPRSEDHHVIKKRYSAFFETNLDKLVASLGIDTIVLAGVNTHACVRMTAIDAYQRDLDVIIAKEAIGSYDRMHEEMSLRYMNGKIASVVSIADVSSRLHQ